MSDELCPFCGGEGGNINDEKCHKPSCYFVKQNSIDVGYGLIKEWNTRPIEDALRKQLEAARDKFTVLKTMLSDDTTNRYYTRPLIGLIDSALAEIEKRKDNNN